MSDKMTPPLVVGDFFEKSVAWKRSACEWLGLDLEIVTEISSVDRFGPEHLRRFVEPGMYDGLRFECLSDTQPEPPKRGELGHWNVTIRSEGVEPVILWSNAVVFRSYEDAKDFCDTVGPEPKMFSNAEQVLLRGLFSVDD